VIGERRQGDIPTLWADVKKAKNILLWEAKLSLEQSLMDAWRWQSKLNTARVIEKI
jgi:UDP-glucose 4-epimerase